MPSMSSRTVVYKGLLLANQVGEYFLDLQDARCMSALGLVHQQQSLFYKQGVFAATYPGKINFMQIAAGFGLETCDLNNEADPQAALQEIINRPGPALIHVRIDAEEKVYPMVPPGAANTEMVGE